MHLRCLAQRSVLAFARVHAHECAEPNDARLLGLGSTRCRNRLVRKLPATACARAAMAAFGLLLCPIGRGAWRSRHPSVAHGAVPGEATTRKWPSEKLRRDLQIRESCVLQARARGAIYLYLHAYQCCWVGMYRYYPGSEKGNVTKLSPHGLMT